MISEAKGKMKKKFLSILLAASMMISLMPNFPYETLMKVSAKESSDTTAERKDDGYISPEYEEGKINLNGFYTVGNDGALMANLEWTYPYKNPLTGEGVDPGRPYKYRMWQSKKNKDGTWTEWDTRSPVDVDKSDGQVRVLNVYPIEAAKEYLQNWMNMKATDYDGTETTVSRGIIKVYPVSIDSFNANAATILKTDPDTGKLTEEYQYSVIMFGTSDGNAAKDLSVASRDETEAFSNAGGGLLFGHDTLRLSHVNFKYFEKEEFLNIQMNSESASHMSEYVKVVDTGFLTSRPWDLEGKTLHIPVAHVLGQYVPVGSPTRVWMQFSDASGNVSGNLAGTPGVNIDNYYLLTNGSTAMIQTGHTSGGATLDEAKVFANTLIYLAQSTVTTTARDSSFIDEAAPNKPSGKVASIVPADDLKNYVAHIDLSGGKDNGTDYAYKIQAIPQTTLEGDNDYKELWSTSVEDPTDESVLHLTAISGLKGYYVKSVNNNPNPEVADRTTAKNNLISLSGDGASYTTGNLESGKDYYVHVFAVDYAGNVSEDMIIPISVSQRIATFNHNDGTGNVDKTLLNSSGTVAAMPKDPTREGYAFLGWYNEADEKVDGETVFDEASYPDGVELNAKWIEVYRVTVGQRGEGSVGISTADGQENPFKKGSDVTIEYKASEGYRVAGVWLDGIYQQADEQGKLVIESIDRPHTVIVEFVAQEETSPRYYSVDTVVSGGIGNTITPSIRMESNDPRTSNYKVEWKAADGYGVKQVIVDGIVRNDLINQNQIVFNKIDSDHQIEVIFVKAEELHKQEKYTVETRLVGGPGSITPSMQVEAKGSANVQAVVSDTKNYEIESIKIYDKEGKEVSGFEINQSEGKAVLTNIEADYVVEVKLGAKKQAGTVTIPEEDLLRVDTTIIGEGSISESKIIKRGEDYTVNWEAAEGWKVKEVIIDEDRIFYSEKEPEIQTMSLRAMATPEDESYDFSSVEKNHSVKVVLEKMSAEEQEGMYAVDTRIIGNAGAQISAGNHALEEGSDFLVTWSVLDDYQVEEVWINGELQPELTEAGEVLLENLQENYLVEVVVKRVVNVDTDDDGKPDINIDTDGDGKPDINIDTDGDGKPDVNVDTDGDNKPDVNIDTDGDNQPDINIVDKDKDGKPDNIDPKDPNQNTTPDINIDTDKDGKPDINIDTDKDGEPDINIDTDNDGKPDINIDTDNDNKPNINIDTDNDNKPNINIDTDNDGKPNINIDTDNDGKPDINIDTDNDSKPNINIDTDNDGKADINIDTDNDGKADANIDTDGDGKPDKNLIGAIETSDSYNAMVYVWLIVVSSLLMIVLNQNKFKVLR